MVGGQKTEEILARRNSLEQPKNMKEVKYPTHVIGCALSPEDLPQPSNLPSQSIP